MRICCSISCHVHSIELLGGAGWVMYVGSGLAGHNTSCDMFKAAEEERFSIVVYAPAPHCSSCWLAVEDGQGQSGPMRSEPSEVESFHA